MWGYSLTVTVLLGEREKLAVVSLASGRSMLVKLEGKKEFSARTVLLSEHKSTVTNQAAPCLMNLLPVSVMVM